MLPDPADIGLFADVVRAGRNQLELSQNDLAAAVCMIHRPTVTGNDIARYESGKRIARHETRRALEQALGLPVLTLDIAAAKQRAANKSGTGSTQVSMPTLAGAPSALGRIRAAFLDSGGYGFHDGAGSDQPPDLDDLARSLDQVMQAYQTSRFDEMLTRLPDVVAGAHHAAAHCRGRNRRRARQTLALSGQASAMVLTKLGEHDLAWIASERGLTVAQDADDPAILGSLQRSMVHTLQSHGRTEASTKLAERTADDLRTALKAGSEREISIYGTLLLAASMTAARAGERSTVDELLDEAEHHAKQLGHDTNHLWTAFGPTNVAVHRVATAVAHDDIAGAERHLRAVNAGALPSERRIRYLFDVAMIALRRDRTDEAIATMLEAEQLAPEQVHHHVMAQQIVAHLRDSKSGRQDPRLAQLDRRTRRAHAAA
ncbi:MAG: helix-turn-helix transcriptional regulator [Actinomycetota bacterium]